ncbi:MAG: hypothetical protein DBX47_02255 [Clostridiales bacterium]|nr:MAG: hypothetical protein DBX47_02255 [Clostridiales bacterium]
MTIAARVEKIKGGVAKVKTERPEGCQNCPSNAICATKEIYQWVVNNVGAKEGDAVLVKSGDDKRSLILVSYIFLCPIAIFFVSYFLYTINIFLTFFAVPAAVAFFISLSFLNKKYKNSSEIIKIISEAEMQTLCAKE